MNIDGKDIPLGLLALRLRALVLALGESTTPAWWKTEFMNETGLRFLERLYPRTSFQAAVHAAGKAASDAHDPQNDIAAGFPSFYTMSHE
jgi:hypothetical protein